MISALAYLAVLCFFGDAVCRRLFSYTSWSHRLATAFLIGLLAATWASYLIALAFNEAGVSLAWANVIVALTLLLFGAWLWRRPRSVGRKVSGDGRSERWDWLTLGLLTVLVGWMMLSTYGYEDGSLRIATGLWSDFGPTTAIAQSFALGNNVPTEYPHYAGEPIRYHFLYYFQVGNLTHMGLDPALANNLLSIVSMVAMLALVMALGRRLFRSAAAGRLGAAVFFLHGSLSFLPLLASYGSADAAVAALPNLDHFVTSGFPYHGEEWGIWSQMVFLNQRHLASGIAMVLIVVLFLLDRLPNARTVEAGPAPGGVAPWDWSAPWMALPPSRSGLDDPSSADIGRVRHPVWPGYVLCGLVAGLLPLWNGAMFIAATALLTAWLLVFPNRRLMILLGVSAAIPAIPQLLFLRAGVVAGGQAYPALHWGYVIDDPTPWNVAAYLGFIFGPKLVLIAIALLLGTSVQRRFFLAFTSLVGVAFLFQLGVEVLANHKFINAWLVVANVFAAAGMVVLWRARGLIRLPARLAAAALAAVIVVGGVIEFMPVKNQGSLRYEMDGDALFEWLTDETDQRATFLSHVHVVHPILLAGRRLYYGWPYYAWSAGYAVGAREREYREMFALRSARELMRRLQANGITHVAFDDHLRNDGFAPRLNEDLYRAHFESVFIDDAQRYGNLNIYKVPAGPAVADTLPGAPAEDMYAGGRGSQPGQFDGLRGLAFERDGSLLVADAGNGRVQRFSSNGNLIGTIGQPGVVPASLERPTGVAVDASGLVYVIDAGDRTLSVFDRDGDLVREWSATAEELTDPVDVAVVGEDVYVLDGAGRVLRIRPHGEVDVWEFAATGTALRGPSGLTVAGSSLIVADTGNARVVALTLEGAHIRSWPVPEWAGATEGMADVVGNDSGTLWLSSPATDSILVYHVDGSRLGTLEPAGPDRLDGPAGLALQPGNRLFVANTRGHRITLLTRVNP